jgi:Holliday junction resolvase
MTINSRNKGASGERELIKAINDLTGIELKRNYSQTAFGGHDLMGLDDWAIECKRYAMADNSSKKMWWRQAVEQARRVDKAPIVIYRADRQPWKCILQFPLHQELYDIEDFRCTCEVDLELFCGMLRESM